MSRFFVTGIRKRSGIHTDEGGFNSEAEARAKLDSLAADEDCLLAEVELFQEDSPRTQIIAQCERVGGSWTAVEGELRTRSRKGEAEAILAAANAPTIGS